jgi:hypothetical protein
MPVAARIRSGILVAARLAAWSVVAAAGAAVAQPPPAAQQAPAEAPASPPQAPPAGQERVYDLSQMGAYGGLPLRGLDPTGYLNVDVRADEVVTAARLKLDFTYSPSLIYALSHLKIALNGETVATLPLDKEDAGRETVRTVDLDPRLFTDFNRIGLQLIAHYTLDHCEDPYHSTLWADINPATTLTLATSRIALPDSLALLPAPFFDRHDNGRLTVPFVLPARASPQTLRAAGVVASWLGALASYRNARFPVAAAPPADAHAIAFALPGAMPAGVTLAPLQGPTIAVMANPASPPQSGRKLLVLAGRNEAELQTAAYALVLGRYGMAGSSVTVQSVDLGPPRRPYDAPNWVPVDRPVAFRELVTDPQQLQTFGYNPKAIRVDLQVPPDLYAWASRNAPLNLRYRYTAPSTYNDSVLNIDINDQLVRSERLRPQETASGTARIDVPLLTSIEARADDDVAVPAFRVASRNQFQFLFHLDSQKTGLCASSASDVAQAAIDPDSTLDFSRFAHYAALPNLAYFATSGFPFPRMADLADTAVVVPDAPDARDQEAVLTLLGHMGQWTGLPALRVALVPARAVASVRDRDLLVVGTGSAAALLASWGKSLPLLIEQGKTVLALRDQRAAGWDGWLGAGHERRLSPAGRAVLGAGGPLAALVGFQSPYAQRKSVVAVAATGSAQLGDVLDLLEDGSRLPQVRGDLVVVRGKQVDGLRLGEVYHVGDLPWYARLWVYLSRHSALLAIAGILAGLIVALTIFWALSRLAVRRAGE